MNKEQQRIKIAEACGWKWERLYTGELYGKPMGEQGPLRELPDYLNDLNAMHEAEKVLRCHGPNESDLIVFDRCINYQENIGYNVFATAAQRAEAFIRTLGTWEGNQ